MCIISDASNEYGRLCMNQQHSGADESPSRCTAAFIGR